MLYIFVDLKYFVIEDKILIQSILCLSECNKDLNFKF